MWFMKERNAGVAIGAWDWDCDWDSTFEIGSTGGDDMFAGGSEDFGNGIWGN
jgi:hypothetical protein